jgi:hypothetical protein
MPPELRLQILTSASVTAIVGHRHRHDRLFKNLLGAVAARQQNILSFFLEASEFQSTRNPKPKPPMAQQEQELLVALATAISIDDVRRIVGELEKRFQYTWRPIGDNEANYGLINIGSDPGFALIERITNAVDAVIEREAYRRIGKKGNGRIPSSPREAAELWFQIPGGRVANLGDPKNREPLADQVVVSLREGTNRRQPTVVIRDLGIGLTPALIPRTILSLSGTNKIDKPFLAGAYGQGGSTVLAFSPKGTLIVSRRQPDLLETAAPDVVAVTLARYEELDPAKNKNGRYAYLVTPSRDVPYIPSKILETFAPGTSVVHFDLAIDQYAARMTQLTGSLWWLLQNGLFDPILPIWAEDARPSILGKGKAKERRTIAGNYTRLSDDKRDRIEHNDSVDVHLDHSDGETSVKVNYWVVKSKDESGSSQPIDAYVDPYNPISYTYFGQTHGTDERRFTAERLQLPYLAKYLIIQVELDHLTPAARRELLSSTRDRMKRTPFFFEMRERIVSALAEDEVLIHLNDKRKEELLSRHSEKDRERMRQRFAQLMERLKSGVDATVPGKGKEEGGRPPSGGRDREPLEPLPTKDAPTFLRIANKAARLHIRIDRHALVRLESDAPDGYLSAHIHAKLTMASNPAGLITLESRSDFRGGRARMTVRTVESAKAGAEGTLTVFLFTPDDHAFSSEMKFKLESPKDEPTSGKNSRADVKVPEPVPVHRDEWPAYGWNESSVAEAREDQDGGKIYVNADNQHIAKLLRAGGYQEKGLTRMRNNYVLYVAYYAWLRHVQMKGKDVGIHGRDFEEYHAAELDRVAQTVIQSIAAGSRLADED